MLEYFKKRKKILGMNARNLLYINPGNRKRARHLADDKIFSKKILAKNEIPVPKLLAKITNSKDLENFDWNALPVSFALKPNRGFGGEGILVIYGKRKDIENTWIKADGSKVTIDDLKNHIRNILDGSFSLANVPDIAFFEERLQLLKLFKPYAYKGIPDVRVIVYNKVPIMAMLRLPTKESQGKANLQQGAIGVGIDLASGITTTAVLGKYKIVDYVPGTRLLLSGIKVPYWKDILRLAVKAQEVSGLGYLGADVAIDKERGPVFLELNARPGLSIQISNLDGIRRRLERVEELKIKTIEKGVRVGMDLFGGEIEEGVEDISGKKVIGTVEKIKLIGKDEKEIEAEAKIDTGATATSIDTELAKKLGFEDLINYWNSAEKPNNFSRVEGKIIDEKLTKEYAGKHPDLIGISTVYSSSGSSVRPKVKVTFILDGISVVANANITDRQELDKEVIIGKKNLGKFLIDVNK